MKSFELTCFNCSYQWDKKIEDDDQIAEYGLLSGGGLTNNDDVVCVGSKRGGTYAPVKCPACGVKGPHDVRSLEDKNEV